MFVCNGAVSYPGVSQEAAPEFLVSCQKHNNCGKFQQAEHKNNLQQTTLSYTLMWASLLISTLQHLTCRTRQPLQTSFSSYAGGQSQKWSAETKKKKKPSTTSAEPVKIYIGVGRMHGNVFKPARGKRLPISTLPSAGYGDILSLGLKKHRAFDRNFGYEAHVLLYKDGTIALKIPGKPVA